MNGNDSYRPKDVIERRKELSDDINKDNEHLTFPESRGNSSHGDAANKVRDRADAAEIDKLRQSDDISELVEMLDKL